MENASACLTIAARFRGPPQSGNGGYTSGLLAEHLDGPAEVTLRAPPPLDTPLSLERDSDGRVTLRDGVTLLAEGQAIGPLELELPEAVDYDRAVCASRGFPGWKRHPLPGCFVCGTERGPKDGLQLYPGPVEASVGDRGLSLAATGWVPGPELARDGAHVDSRIVWAALDCPAWFGFVAFAAELPPMALMGRIAASISRAPRVGERCAVAGWSYGREGRRILCASALFGEDGACLAASRSTWIVLKT